ncbi:helix-turn-helix domain-containing protein [Catelliglobosispora koreensis]|uniref:helix-turn-helix domain-containing protein n=1 Tax=Catelliglobosispora koreensis TaxID=129052 RepID=UPI00037A7501|nr:ImmA/IrrE family metallo-endopeptidase [Catelliglobosispora koreensis]
MEANAAMLTLARESRGLRQGELAEAMAERLGEPVSQGYVSKAEAGRLPVTDDRLQAISNVLHYPAEMLCSEPDANSVGVGLMHHRKKASLGALTLRRIHAQVTFSRSHVQNLLALVDDFHHEFDRYVLTDEDSPSEIAQRVRRDWGLGDKPVGNLVAAIEAAGGIVLERDFATRELDAISQWPQDRVPMMLLNPDAPADRFRFSLAHELGHLLMHHEPGSTPLQERQADEFASALLMPASAIRHELRQGTVDLGRLAELKPVWGASMSALARRALDLRALSEWRYRDLMVEYSILGFRQQEPVSISSEHPSKFRNIIVDLMKLRGCDLDQLAVTAGLFEDEFEKLYLTVPSH